MPQKAKNPSSGIFVRGLRREVIMGVSGLGGPPKPPLRGSGAQVWYIPNLGGWAILPSKKKKSPKIFVYARYETPVEGVLTLES